MSAGLDEGFSVRRLFSGVAAWLKRIFIYEPEPATYELVLDGVCAFVQSTQDGGKRITVSGWFDGHWEWEEGDYLILFRRKPGPVPVLSSTRYRIVSIYRPGKPLDQYFVECEFAPRETT